MGIREGVVKGILTYLYGREILDSIGEVTVEVSSRTGRVRNVYINGELAFTLRMSDGYLVPTLAGARLIRGRVTVASYAAPFIRQGRSVIARSVVKVDNANPGSEVAVYSGNELLGVGTLVLSEEEIRTVGRGIAVKMRHHTRETATR
jgi:uncharacterized protein with predicted RNA binding PUA domain